MGTLVFVMCIVCCVVSADLNFENKKKLEDNESVEVFKPTREWQTVKEGQAIPKGLHVRINLETGKKEAKLLSNDSVNKRTDVLSMKKDTADEDENIPTEHSKAIKESLLKLESTGKIKTDDVGNTIREKFRSYKELKEAFNQLNLTVKTDLEIMNELVSRFKASLNRNTNTFDEKLLILTDLEYLVHQYDNALEFIKLEGITDIVFPMLNNSESQLRAAAAHLLGSAAQSNVKVQIAGLENGAINSLLKTLWLDSDKTVQIRSVYALSCLIRNFPAAQEKFVKEGGLSIFAQVFEKAKENHKLQIKLITLLYDLLLERQNTKKLLLEQYGNKSDLEMRLEQYKAVGLEESLTEHGWCARVPEFLLNQDQNWNRAKRREDLTSAITDIPVRPEHDFVEKVAEALLAMSDLCNEEFKNNPNLKRMISGLNLWYRELSVKESLTKAAKYGNAQKDTDEDYVYYSGVASVLDKLSKKLGIMDIKDEL